MYETPNIMKSWKDDEKMESSKLKKDKKGWEKKG